jgi:ribose 5-phosphate isomerase A
MNAQDQKKKLVGEKAAEFVEEGMVVGLGSGTTIYWLMKRLGERVQQGLKISGVPSSKKTERWAQEFGIPLTDFSNLEKIDIAIDGTNEVDSQFHLIKGGGGSLVREKIINAFSEQLVIIADEEKICERLGRHPLPIEIVPFGWEVTSKRVEKLGCKADLRMQNNQPFISDNGNYIVDCQFDSIENPIELHKHLKLVVGVIETGLFCNMVDTLVIGKQDQTEIITDIRSSRL